MRTKIDPIVSDVIQLQLGSRIEWGNCDTLKGRTRHLVVCGGCGHERMIFRSYIQSQIRRRERYTGLCETCSRFISQHSKVDPVESAHVSLELGSVINWSTTGANRHGQTTHEVICGLCKEPRMVNRAQLVASDAENRTTFTGLCKRCSLVAHPLPKFIAGPLHPAFKRGVYLTDQGYIAVLASALSDEEFILIAPTLMSGGNGAKRILEHRLVMARHLNRPLLKSEIVHHRNGIRTDNRIENLELLTRDTHFPGHDHDYQSAQEAISEISRLRSLVVKLGGNPDDLSGQNSI